MRERHQNTNNTRAPQLWRSFGLVWYSNRNRCIEKMESPSETALDEFLRLAHSWSDGYRRCVRSVFALKHNDEWHLQLMITAYIADFVDTPEIPLDPILIETESILGVREVVYCNESIFDGIPSAEDFNPFEVTICGYLIKSASEDGNVPSYYFEPRHLKEHQSPYRRPALIATGKEPLRLYHSFSHGVLDLELLGNKIPYENVSDLLFSLSLPTDAFQSGQSIPRSTYIISPPVLIEERSSISASEANVFVRCNSHVNSDDIEMSIRAFNRSAQPDRIPIAKSEIKWEKAGNWKTGVTKIDLSDHPLAAVHLSFNKDFLCTWYIRDDANSLNNRLLVHKVFHRDGTLQKALKNESGNNFEAAVTALLSLYGLNCVTYGPLRDFSAGPDIIAYSGAGHLYVIECKGGAIKEGKLHELKLRFDNVLKTVKHHGIDIKYAVPVLVTSLQRDQTRAKWSEAAELGISLVCEENLERLVHELEIPSAPQVLFDSALSLIPLSDRGDGT